MDGVAHHVGEGCWTKSDHEAPRDFPNGFVFETDVLCCPRLHHGVALQLFQRAHILCLLVRRRNRRRPCRSRAWRRAPSRQSSRGILRAPAARGAPPRAPRAPWRPSARPLRASRPSRARSPGFGAAGALAQARRRRRQRRPAARGMPRRRRPGPRRGASWPLRSPAALIALVAAAADRPSRSPPARGPPPSTETSSSRARARRAERRRPSAGGGAWSRSFWTLSTANSTSRASADHSRRGRRGPSEVAEALERGERSARGDQTRRSRSRVTAAAPCGRAAPRRAPASPA